jgi:hypothetical protein
MRSMSSNVSERKTIGSCYIRETESRNYGAQLKAPKTKTLVQTLSEPIMKHGPKHSCAPPVHTEGAGRGELMVDHSYKQYKQYHTHI